MSFIIPQRAPFFKSLNLSSNTSLHTFLKILSHCFQDWLYQMSFSACLPPSEGCFLSCMMLSFSVYSFVCSYNTLPRKECVELGTAAPSPAACCLPVFSLFQGSSAPWHCLLLFSVNTSFATLQFFLFSIGWMALTHLSTCVNACHPATSSGEKVLWRGVNKIGGFSCFSV